MISIEIIPELAESARHRLADLGYHSVTVTTGDGYLGSPEQAPFDGIVVTAAPKEVPPFLVDQLRVGGHLVIPVGGSSQTLQLPERTQQGVRRKKLFEVRFVPMTGKSR